MAIFVTAMVDLDWRRLSLRGLASALSLCGHLPCRFCLGHLLCVSRQVGRFMLFLRLTAFEFAALLALVGAHLWILVGSRFVLFSCSGSVTLAFLTATIRGSSVLLWQCFALYRLSLSRHLSVLVL